MDKQCTKCNEFQDVSIFNKDSTKKDGLCSHCNICRKKYRDANQEHIKEYEQKFAASERGKEVRRIQKRKDYRNHKERIYARNRARKLFRKGRLVVEKKCEECGSEENIELHHDNYNLPLEVRPLCFTCHRKWHQENTPIYFNPHDND